MIGSRAGVAIGGETQECIRPCADERQRRNPMFGTIVQIIRNVETGDCDRQRVRIINLKPIVVTGRRIRHPFIHFEIRDISKRGHGGVGSIWGRIGKHPIATAIRDAANRQIGRLDTIDDKAQQTAAVRGRVKEINSAAARFEGKVRVDQRADIGVTGIAQHAEISRRREHCAGRKHKPPRLQCIVCQAEVTQVDDIRCAVVKLHPIGRSSALRKAGVQREHFIDDQRAAKWRRGNQRIRRARSRRFEKDDIR